MRHLLPIALLTTGCRCGGAPTVAPEHVVGWEGLLDAARRGDTEDAAEWGRALAVTPADDDWEERAGAALGMIAVAEDVDEVALGVSRVAAACGTCHVEHRVPAPPSPPAVHDRATEWIARPALFGVALAVPPDVLRAEPGSDSADLAGRLIACAACHAEPG